jgi:hypothetical protein
MEGYVTMEAKVIRILTETIIQLDTQWSHFNHRGALVKIIGLIPGESGREAEDKKALEDLVLNKKVEIAKQYYSITAQHLH